jgi:hypothetical protein
MGIGMPPASPFPGNPAQPPGLGQMMAGGLMSGEQPMAPSPMTGTSLPPRRAAGQQPLSSVPPAGNTPGWTPPQGGLGLGMPPMDPSQAYGTPAANPPTGAVPSHPRRTGHPKHGALRQPGYDGCLAGRITFRA